MKIESNNPNFIIRKITGWKCDLDNAAEKIGNILVESHENQLVFFKNELYNPNNGGKIFYEPWTFPFPMNNSLKGSDIDNLSCSTDIKEFGYTLSLKNRKRGTFTAAKAINALQNFKRLSDPTRAFTKSPTILSLRNINKDPSPKNILKQSASKQNTLNFQSNNPLLKYHSKIFDSSLKKSSTASDKSPLFGKKNSFNSINSNNSTRSIRTNLYDYTANSIKREYKNSIDEPKNTEKLPEEKNRSNNIRNTVNIKLLEKEPSVKEPSNLNRKSIESTPKSSQTRKRQPSLKSTFSSKINMIVSNTDSESESSNKTDSNSESDTENETYKKVLPQKLNTRPRKMSQFFQIQFPTKISQNLANKNNPDNCIEQISKADVYVKKNIVRKRSGSDETKYIPINQKIISDDEPQDEPLEESVNIYTTSEEDYIKANTLD